MPIDDILLVFQWWSALFLIGASAYPLTKRFFPTWYDHGYLFAKAVGFAVVSYIVYIAGTLHVFPFTTGAVGGAMGLLFIGGMLPTVLSKKNRNVRKKERSKTSISALIETWDVVFWKRGLIVVVEEILFFLALLLWSWVKAHEPSIRGLEKFMDYGFMQSILNSRYFPAPDMWWAGGSINYYYFGHLVTAVLTKLSGLSLGYTYNLMLDTIFALTATMSFSIGFQLLHTKQKIHLWIAVVGGVLTSFLVTLAGNMQTIYAFTKGYTGEDVKPFWDLLWPFSQFFEKIGEGMQTYWYANATRFIPFSIHEFPSYSFVVSDVHGHVLSLPFVLLALALLITLFVLHRQEVRHATYEVSWMTIGFYGFLVGILLMTNALDGPIYGGLFALSWFVFVLLPNLRHVKQDWWRLVYPVGLVALLAVATALPFLFFFNSFANGIGVNCPPAFLAGTSIGPFIFEEVEKCQHSPLWMMWLLWGFFWFTGAWLFVSKLWKKEGQNGSITRILKVFFLFGIGLIIFPEFLYVKDIYPAHFRSNTMFKLGYQAFIMWSIVSGYVITNFCLDWRQRGKEKIGRILRSVFILFLIPQLFLVSIYPVFSVRSYFAELRTYHEIWGLGWLQEEFFDDWKAIEWLKEQGKGQAPVIVEAAGDSYTDFNHISAFTGFPTITGWAVHEWLWRGSFDIVSPRQEDVRRIYESSDKEETAAIIAKYNVRYVIVGLQEREKYPYLQEAALDTLGARVFTSQTTTIWEVGKR